MNKYKVSCIVPVYNLGNKVDKCVESLINQTLEEIEIILVDDCSTDRTAEILDEWRKKDNRITVLQLKKNKRQGGARNDGLKIARGEYISFIDGDDWIDSNMMEDLYNYAVLNDCDIVDSDYFQEDETGNCEIRISIPEKYLINYNKKRIIINSGRLWSKIIRRKLLIENKLFFIENKKFEDNPYFPVVIPYADKIGKINKAYYHYIYNENSTSRNQDDFTIFGRLETALYLIHDAKKRGLYKKYKEEYNYKFIELYYVNTIVACITKFQNIPFEYVDKVYNGIHKYLPNYKKNIYITQAPLYFRVICHCNKFTLHLLCKIGHFLNSTNLRNSVVKRVKKK